MTEFEKAMSEDKTLSFTFTVDGIGAIGGTSSSDEYVGTFLVALGTLVIEHGVEAALRIMLEDVDPELN